MKAKEAEDTGAMKAKEAEDTGAFIEAVRLTQVLGETVIGHQTVRSSTTYRGVSLWDLMSAVWAAFYFPPCLTGSGDESGRAFGVGEAGRSYLRFLRRVCTQCLFSKSSEHYSWRRASPIGVVGVVFEHRQLETLLPVLAEAQSRRPKETVAIIGTRSSLDAVTDYRIRDCRRFPFMIGLRRLLRCRSEIRSMQRQFALICSHPSFRAVSSSKGDSAGHLLRGVLKDFQIGWIPWLIGGVAEALSQLKTIRPTALIAPDDCDPRVRLFFACAHLRGIPTLHVQYAAVSPRAVNWHFPMARRTALMGRSSRDCLEQMGVSISKVRITGQPRFDQLVRRATMPTVQPRNGKSSRILFCSQPLVGGSFPSESRRRMMIAEVFEACMRLPDAHLVVKPHPDESVSTLKACARPYPPHRITFLKKRSNVHAAIEQCHVFVTFFSTTSIEALIAGKEVAYFDLPGRLRANPHVLTGIASGARTADELSQAIGCGLDNSGRACQKRRRVLEEDVHLLDGLAASRVVDVVEELLNRGISANRRADCARTG